MAVVTRYFSTSSAGAADGTSWANRAALVSGGAINTIISAFNFTADALVPLVGPGAYTLTTAIQTFTGAAAPSATFPCIFQACDSSGVELAPPDPNWQSAGLAFTGTSLPELATNTNISTCSNASVGFIGFKFAASGRNGTLINSCRSLDWCSITNSTSNTSAVGVATVTNGVTNTVIRMTGTAFDAAANGSASFFRNVRLEGNVSASSGNRMGFASASNIAHRFFNLTAFGFVGGAVRFTGATSGVVANIERCTLIGASGSAAVIYNTGTSTTVGTIIQCIIVNGSTWAFENASTGRMMLINNRFRDNTSGTVTGNGSLPSLLEYTTDTDDTEFVDAASGDYRVKNTAAIWGKGYGAGDQAAASGGGMSRLINGGLVRGQVF
jgi:hypothetical protein